MPVETPHLAASLIAVTPHTPNIHTLRISSSLKFKPGQSVQVLFPGDQKKRFYSISSSPTEGPFIEITVKSEPGSALSQAIIAFKRNDPLEITGPFGGSLALPDSVQEPLVFIAAGTGVTPFRSMIRYLIDEETSQNLWLLHSVRSQNELLFHDDFAAWSGNHKQFHYIPTITQDFDNNWKHETGHINDTLIRKHITAPSCTFFLCGPSGFVGDMDKTLQQTLAVPAAKIRREKW